MIMTLLLALLLLNPVSAGDAVLGEAKFMQNCKQCHGPAGMGMASYPKVSGNDIDYTIDKLKTYRDGIEVGPNSALMIMMARPLSDIDIHNLAAYLKEAKR
jgi:cytochrome c553|tara:strand:- start:116 stop:418 length:303 start_codon:yes stop_codon:yes gene_type:complete